MSAAAGLTMLRHCLPAASGLSYHRTMRGQRTLYAVTSHREPPAQVRAVLEVLTEIFR